MRWFALGYAVQIVVVVDGKIRRQTVNRQAMTLLKEAVPGIGPGSIACERGCLREFDKQKRQYSPIGQSRGRRTSTSWAACRCG